MGRGGGSPRISKNPVPLLLGVSRSVFVAAVVVVVVALGVNRSAIVIVFVMAVFTVVASPGSLLPPMYMRSFLTSSPDAWSNVRPSELTTAYFALS